MRKIFVFLMLCLSVSVQAQDTLILVDGFYYKFSGAEAEVAWCGDTEYMGKVVIPSTVTHKGRKYSVTGIREDFSRGYNFTSITIPASVTSLRTGAFSYGSLTSIDVESENTNYSSSDGVLFNKNKTSLLCYPGEKKGDYVIPNSVTTIEKRAFLNSWHLTSVIIPESVTTIGMNAYSRCEGLTFITCLNPVPVDISNQDVFSYVNKKACTLKVPASAVSAYKKADVWKEFKIISITEQDNSR